MAASEPDIAPNGASMFVVVVLLSIFGSYGARTCP
jgi:hypothetical protein